MKPLSHDARALVDAARAAESPPDGYQAQMRLRLEARLGVSLGEASAASIAPQAAGANGGVAGGVRAGALAKMGVIIAVLGVLVAGGVLLRGDMGSARVVVPAVESVQTIASGVASLSTMSLPVPDVPSTSALATASEAAAPPRAQTAQPRRPAVSPQAASARSLPAPRAVPDDTITDELSLLRRAQGRLSSGQADQALALLEQHAREHPDGALREERMAARVFALCALGRKEEARAEAERFVAALPRSPLVAHVRSACAGEASGPKP